MIGGSVGAQVALMKAQRGLDKQGFSRLLDLCLQESVQAIAVAEERSVAL